MKKNNNYVWLIVLTCFEKVLKTLFKPKFEPSKRTVMSSSNVISTQAAIYIFLHSLMIQDKVTLSTLPLPLSRTYVSVNSKPDHPPPDRPLGIRTFSLPRRSGFCPTFFARRGRGFELEKFSTVLKETCRDFLI